MEMLGHVQVHAGMPTGVIEYEHNLLGAAGADLTCELGEFDFKHRNTDGRRQMEDGPSRGGMDKANQIAPGEPMLDSGDRPMTNRRPDAQQEWLKPNAMFVGRPQLDLRVRKGRRHHLQQRPHFFEDGLLFRIGRGAC